MSLLARISLANRGLVALITIAILGIGAAVLPQLRQQMFPDLQFPIISVVSQLPGATPEIVEQQVSIPIEQAVSGIDGVTAVSSTSRNGSSAVSVTFDFGADVKVIAADVEQALSRLQGRLPASVDPLVIAGTTDDIPVIQLAASGADGDEQELVRRIRATVLPELNGIDGVRDVTLSGAREQQVAITVQPAKLAATGLSVQAITTALTANGVSIPGGVINEGGLAYSVAVGGRFSTLDQLKELYLVGAPGAGTPVQLKDVATIESAPAAATSLTRTNGKPSLGIGVTAMPGANAVEISHAVNDKLGTLAAQLGAGGTLAVIFDQAPEVERSVSSLTTEGLLGLAFAVLVILIFLLSVRSTLVTAVSIPVSVVIALIALWVGDYSLNLLTLGGLTIAIGRVVDDSIVVLENIKRHLDGASGAQGHGGDPKKQAILAAVKEVSGAVTASTLTTVAVFLPVALVGGLIGQFFGPFGLTVTAALLASLLVSLTIVPVLAFWFLKAPTGTAAQLAEIREKAEAKELRSRLQRSYVPVLRWSLAHRWTVLGVAGLIIAGTVALAGTIETSFIGGSGNSLSITQELPAGTSQASTDEAAKKIENVLNETDGIASYQVTVGGGNFFSGGDSSSTRSSFRVTTEAEVDQAKITEELRTKIEALGDGLGEVTVGAAGGGFGSSNLEVQIEAADEATLRAAAEQVQQAVASLPNVTNVASDLAASTPQIQVTLDRTAAAPLGFTDAALGQLVSSAFRGTPVTRIVLDGTEQQVLLRTGAAPTDLAKLRALPIAGGLTLDDIATVETVAGPSQIKRVDQARTATITATPTNEALGTLNAQLTEKLDTLTLPAGATVTVGGVTADQQDAFADLGLAMLVALALVFIIMIATFRGLVQPLILLISVPFAATGALGLLAITGQPLGLAAMIGLLMLVGIVVTNAIVLLDLINQYRADGRNVRDSIIEGGRRRLRPILMTAVATIFALLPMSLGLTESSAFISQPLAVVVIGGLVTSTLLTLVLVPVLYSLVEGRKEGRAQRKAAAVVEILDADQQEKQPDLATV